MPNSESIFSIYSFSPNILLFVSEFNKVFLLCINAYFITLKNISSSITSILGFCKTSNCITVEFTSGAGINAVFGTCKTTFGFV